MVKWQVKTWWVWLRGLSISSSSPLDTSLDSSLSPCLCLLILDFNFFTLSLTTSRTGFLWLCSGTSLRVSVWIGCSRSGWLIIPYSCSSCLVGILVSVERNKVRWIYYLMHQYMLHRNRTLEHVYMLHRNRTLEHVYTCVIRRSE